MRLKQGSLFLIVVLLSALLAACGGAAPANTTSGPQLSETFTANEEGINVTFNYPQGWVTNAGAGQIALANSQATLDLVGTGSIESINIPDDGYGMQMVLLPVAEMPPDTTPVQLLTMLAEGAASQEGVTVSAVEEVQINGQGGAKANVTFPQDSGEIYLFPSGENYVMLFAAASNYDNFRATTQAIANTVQVQ